MWKFSQIEASYKISQDLSFPLAYLQGFPGQGSGIGYAENMRSIGSPKPKAG
jgi:hypothetical protein